MVTDSPRRAIYMHMKASQAHSLPSPALDLLSFFEASQRHPSVMHLMQEYFLSFTRALNMKPVGLTELCAQAVPISFLCLLAYFLQSTSNTHFAVINGFSAASAGAIATMATHPFDVVKVSLLLPRPTHASKLTCIMEDEAPSSL